MMAAILNGTIVPQSHTLKIIMIQS